MVNVPGPLGEQCNGYVVKVVHRYLDPQENWKWMVSPHFTVTHRGQAHRVIGIREQFLKPLRGGEGEDEMLRIAGKPQGVQK